MNIFTYLIVCPMLFLAGFVDSIAGGGGLISLPAYILAGLPIHNAIATNITALVIFILNGSIWISLGLAAAVFNMLGNYAGSSLAIKQSTRITKPLIIVVLILLFIKILTGF